MFKQTYTYNVTKNDGCFGRHECVLHTRVENLQFLQPSLRIELHDARGHSYRFVQSIDAEITE